MAGMNIEYTLMRCGGRGFVVVYDPDAALELSAEQVVGLCDLQDSGVDGVLLLRLAADVQNSASLQFIASDGSPGGVGGEALVCAAKFLVDSKLTARGASSLSIEAGSGLYPIRVMVDHGGEMVKAIVDMGEPEPGSEASSADGSGTLSVELRARDGHLLVSGTAEIASQGQAEV